MSSVSHVSTVSPVHLVDRDALTDVSEKWLAEDEKAQEKFLRISAHSGVDTRKFVIPYDNILNLNGLESRANTFEQHGTELLSTAIERCLEINNQDPAEVGALVFTSCSVPIIPSIDAAAILKTRLPANITRVPMYQQGCAGGVVALSLGAKLAELGKPVMIAATELCSLVFQPQNHSGAHLVGAAIFADGAAATLLAPAHGKLNVIASESYLIPDSRHLMGYDIFDDGFHLRLDRTLPSTLVQRAPQVLGSFLERNGRTAKDVDYWLFHPGGIKILEFLRETFSLSQEQCHWSYDVLREHGNLSSATILYVLESFMRDVTLKRNETAMIMGIGPGLTIEMILLEG